jgi:hypothetical protein
MRMIYSTLHSLKAIKLDASTNETILLDVQPMQPTCVGLLGMANFHAKTPFAVGEQTEVAETTTNLFYRDNSDRRALEEVGRAHVACSHLNAVHGNHQAGWHEPSHHYTSARHGLAK